MSFTQSLSLSSTFHNLITSTPEDKPPIPRLESISEEPEASSLVLRLNAVGMNKAKAVDHSLIPRPRSRSMEEVETENRRIAAARVQQLQGNDFEEVRRALRSTILGTDDVEIGDDSEEDVKEEDSSFSQITPALATSNVNPLGLPLPLFPKDCLAESELGTIEEEDLSWTDELDTPLGIKKREI